MTYGDQFTSEQPVPGDPEFYQTTNPISFTKKVEVLRALALTAKQFNEEFGGIQQLPFCVKKSQKGNIKSIDLKLMEEFKKVYSLGTNQLESFIKALNEAAPSEDDQGGSANSDKLDEYSILYYVSLLEKGPYENQTGQVTGRVDGIEKITVEVFKPGPDIMGVNANSNLTNSSKPVYGVQRAQNVPNDTLRKVPGFISNLLSKGIVNASSVFQNAVFLSGAIDENTLPFIDKQNDARVQEELADGRNKTDPAHGNLMVKDVEKIKIHKDAEEGITEEINNFLGDKAFRLFLFRKLINYFSEEQNLAHSKNGSIDRKVDYIVQEFEEDEDNLCEANQPEKFLKKSKDVETDMFGRTFDSTERREFEFKTQGANGENLFKLYTIKGQLGSGIDVKSESMFGD